MKKSMSSYDDSDFVDTEEEMAGKPEIALKYKIIEGLDLLFKMKVELMHFNKSNRYARVSAVDLERQVVYVFDLLSEMIKEKGLDKSPYFNLIRGISVGRKYQVKYLIQMVDYLKECAHKLKFTNLLIRGGHSLDDKLRRSFGQ
jgi:hypothetical protein